MKGLPLAALAIAIALPVCAQRGGGGGHASAGGHAGFAGHGMSSGRPAPAFRSGFAPSAPIHYGNGSAFARPPVSYPSSIRLGSGVRYSAHGPIGRPAFYHPGYPYRPGRPTHAFIIRTYPSIFPYAYPSYGYGYGYLPTDIFDDSYDNYYDPSQQQLGPEEGQPDYGSAYPQPMPQPDYGYPQQAPQPDYGYAYPQPMPAYPGYPQPQPGPEGAYAYPVVPPGYEAYAPEPVPVAPQMQYVPGSATTVILIYRDGRPPEQIQNYLATGSTLTVLDGGRRREIPLSALNIPATISANRQTGVDFQLPAITR
jgi:hypothetical protein